MRRKADGPIDKCTLNLYQGDFAKMGELHPGLGPSRAIRELVRQHIRGAEAHAGSRQSPPPKLEMPSE